MTLNAQKISFFLPPLIGAGCERVVLNLTRVLVDWNYTVDLVLPDTSGRHAQFTSSIPKGVRIIDFDLQISKTIYLQKLFKLRQYLDSEKPAIIFANVDYVGVTNLAISFSNTPTKLVQVVHSNLSQEFGKITGLGKNIKPLLVKYFYPKSDGIIAVSKGVAQDLSQTSGIPLEKIKVIYNPVVTPELSVMAQKPVNHRWLQPGEPPVILGVGRLMFQKDFSNLIQAFHKVRGKQDCRLIILGGENYEREKLENLIKELDIHDYVDLYGFSDNPFAFMAKASIFALSSRYEGFGNVLVEAMATGTPVVSTDCKSGPAEILENGKYGKLVPICNSEALAEAILDTLENPKDTTLLQERASDFTIEKITAQYLKFADSLLSAVKL